MTFLAEINDVVYECLDACYESAEPELRLAQWITRLHGQADWTDSEIDEIESTARQLMYGYFDRRLSSQSLTR